MVIHLAPALPPGSCGLPPSSSAHDPWRRTRRAICPP